MECHSLTNPSQSVVSDKDYYMGICVFVQIGKNALCSLRTTWAVLLFYLPRQTQCEWWQCLDHGSSLALLVTMDAILQPLLGETCNPTPLHPNQRFGLVVLILWTRLETLI